MKLPRLTRTTVLGLTLVTLGAGPAWAQLPQPGVDSDGDGVTDDLDVEPCNLAVAGWSYAPADRAYGMLLFEDQWPNRGDFDFNDAVIAYHEVLNFDAAGLLTGLRVDLDVMAVGAKFDNGLAIRLPVPRALIAEALIAVGPASWPLVASDSGTSASQTWPSEAEAVLTLAPSLHALFGVDAAWVNTDPAQPVRGHVHITLQVKLSPGHTVSATEAPFDIFLFDQSRGVEIHLPRYAGTSRLDTSLVGTADDGTTPGRAFVTTNGIPFALDIGETVAYPTEGRPIDQLYPDIVVFGQSGGQQAANFYQLTVASQHAFTNQMAPTALPAVGAADVSCFSPDPGVCGAAIGAGHVDAPMANLCAFGAPSAVSTTGAQFEWTCTGFYSAPTACNAPDLLCTPNAPDDCSAQIANGSGARSCNGSGTGYTTCVRTSCNAGFIASGDTCVPQVCSPSVGTQSCPISNGAGSQTCNTAGTGWGSCLLVGCDSGFYQQGQQCLPVPTNTTITPGNTTSIATFGDYSAQCLMWNGKECIQARLNYRNTGFKGMCWGNNQIFELWCHVASGNRQVASTRNVCDESLSTDSTWQYLLTYGNTCPATWSTATTLDTSPEVVSPGLEMCQYFGSCGCDPKAVTCAAW